LEYSVSKTLTKYLAKVSGAEVGRNFDPKGGDNMMSLRMHTALEGMEIRRSNDGGITRRG
jgi:hypothetical protein